MRSQLGPALAFVLGVPSACACKLEPPPAVPEQGAADEADESVDDSARVGEGEAGSDDASSESAQVAKPEPSEPSELDALMAGSTCEVLVDGVLKAGRGSWSGVGKYRCTYKIFINGAAYKYTRLVPGDRKREPEDVCEDGSKSMESVVRSATRECRDLQVSDRQGLGLTRMR